MARLSSAHKTVQVLTSVFPLSVIESLFIDSLLLLFLLTPCLLQADSAMIIFDEMVYQENRPVVSAGIHRDPESTSRAVKKLIADLPEYTCVTTVERSSQANECRSCGGFDRIRLESTFSGGEALFAWPKPSLPGDPPLAAVLGTGIFQSLDWAGMIAEMLAFCTWAPEATEGANVHCDFRVPEESSHYDFWFNGQLVHAAYNGTLWVDRATFRPLRLEASTATGARTMVEFASGEDGLFLHPAVIEFSLSTAGGARLRNRSTYEQCKIGTSLAPEGQGGPRPVVAILPGGLQLDVGLTKTIDVNRAAIGDLVFGRLEKQVRRRGVLLLEKGAAVIGRITALVDARGREVSSESTAYLPNLPQSGLAQKARQDMVIHSSDVRPKAHSSLAFGFSVSELNGARAAFRSQVIDFFGTYLAGNGNTIIRPPSTESEMGVMHFPTGVQSLPKGFRLKLLTAPSPVTVAPPQ